MRRAEFVTVAAVVTLFVARVLANWKFVPLWDGRIYADCVISAVRVRDVSALNCAGHPTIGYTALVAMSQVASLGSYGAMLVVNAVLGAAMLVAFYAVLGGLDPGRHAAARLLCTAALSTHPVLLASAVNLTPDYGVTVFFVLTVWALSEGHLVVAAGSGTLLALSKEPGIAMYAVALAGHAASATLGLCWRDRLRRAVRWGGLVIPFLAFAAFLLSRTKTDAAGVKSTAMWGGETPFSILLRLVLPSFGTVQRGYLLWIFAAGFQWVLVVVLIAAGVHAVRVRAKPTPSVAFVMTMLLAGTYVLTRYPTFVNPRYLLVLAPLLLALAFLAIPSVTARRAAATATFAIVTVLFAWSSVRTVDPVMKAAYGTFAFGRHELLDTTSLTGECCGYGRDQLVYNLEFTRLASLQDRIYSDVLRDKDAVVLAHPAADWFFAGRLDEGHRRTLLDGKELRLLSLGDLRDAPRLPATAYYVAFPNFRNGFALKALSERYDVSGLRTYDENGYRIEVHALRLRPH